MNKTLNFTQILSAVKNIVAAYVGNRQRGSSLGFGTACV